MRATKRAVFIGLLACFAGGCGLSPAQSGSDRASPGASSSSEPTTEASPTQAPIIGDAIAFHADPDGDDDFYRVGADGTGLRPLTRMAETVAFPYWSPDGRMIAYLCCSGADASLWIMDADGSEPRRLTSGRTGSPSWSSDGTQLAFEDHADGGLWVIGRDGANPRRLAADSGGPRWSPDGTRIAFITWRHHPGQEQRNELYVMQADGTGEIRLTSNEAEDVEPAWSPDGEWLAFVSTRDGNPEIYVSTLDGRDQRRLTNDPVPDEGPAWSPDGSLILFTSYRGGADPLTLGQGNAEIFTVRPDGTRLQNLTRHPDWDGYPAWSPDGTRIAFSINNGVEFDLYLMNSDGSGRRRLAGVSGANGIANDCCPAWRP